MLRLKVSILVICLGLASLVPGVTIPFNPERGLLEVKVKIDGRFEGIFGIDTGADRLYMDRSFALKNGLSLKQASKKREVVSVGGTSEVGYVSLRSVEIGDERLYNLTSTVVDMNALSGHTGGQNPDGLIGFDVLRNFYVTVDYPLNQLTLEKIRPTELNKSNFTTVPFRLYEHLILVEVAVNGSKPVSMILDYCASYTSITPKLAERLELNSLNGSLSVLKEVKIGDGAIGRNIQAIVTDLSPITYKQRGLDIEGVIGTSFLFQHKITVDYTRQRIYFLR